MRLIRVLLGIATRHPRAHRVRVLAAVLGMMILFLGSRSLLVTLLWAVGVTIGARYKLAIRASMAGPSWTGAIWGGIIGTTLGTILSHSGPQLPKVLYAFALAVNVTYLGAKAGCLIIGCCGAESKHARRTATQSFSSPSLQIIELCATGVVLTLGTMLIGSDHKAMAVVVLMTGHSVVRGYSGLVRFPFRSIGSIVLDPAVGVLAVGSAVAAFAIR